MNLRVATVAACIAAFRLADGAPVQMPLWPEDRVPDFSKEQTVPSLSVSLPEKRTCDALIVIAPGGSYMKWCEWEGRCAEYFKLGG